MNTQAEVLKRTIDNMILQENQDGLNEQEKFIMQKLMREKYQMEHEARHDNQEDSENGSSDKQK